MKALLAASSRCLAPAASHRQPPHSLLPVPYGLRHVLRYLLHYLWSHRFGLREAAIMSAAAKARQRMNHFKPESARALGDEDSSCS